MNNKEKNIKTTILPFKPYIFDEKAAASDIKNLVAPPYDVIGPDLQDELYERSDFNIVRLEFGKGLESDGPAENKYTRADATFRDWIEKGIMKKEKENSIYIYSQAFRVDGVLYERTGFLSLFGLPESKEDASIYGHETTLSKPKEDRFRLFEAAKANFSPIFSVFEDREKTVLNILKESVAKGKAVKLFDFTDENDIRNILYRLPDGPEVSAVRNEMRQKAVYIADGHHRFETSVNFRDYVNQNGIKGIDAGACLMYFAPSEQEGLLILPTHRGIKGKEISVDSFLESVKDDFNYREVTLEELLNETKGSGKSGTSFGFAHSSGRGFILSFKTPANGLKQDNPLSNLDVTILQDYILKKALKITQEEINNQTYLVYEKDAAKAMDKIRNKTLEALFFMNPTGIEDVIRIASLNLRMPQKSTFFFPKILTGLAVNSLKI